MRSFFLSLVFVIVGCGASSDPGETKLPANSGHEKDDSGSTRGVENKEKSGSEKEPGSSEPGAGPNFSCRLPAPVSSDDACSKDADCAPSVPCHARACVAVSKATPRTPDTMCTMNIDCQSADVNPCSCYQGRCALVPKKPE